MDTPQLLFFFFLVALLRPTNSLFVPEQLPTLLSFVYTNIPPIRKGIDSRVGFGFRLGPNADVQVMLELGPQQNTAPIGPQKADGNSKRETRLPQYKYKYQPNKYRAPVKGSWLQAWKHQQAQIDEGEDVGVMPAQPALDQDVVAHLQQLYKEQPMERDSRILKTAEDESQNKLANEQGEQIRAKEDAKSDKEEGEVVVMEGPAVAMQDSYQLNNEEMNNPESA
uniref:Sulfate adenylyltransferase subunit 2 n=1 Tax=Lygus hesperus TaxID=30085 RepID=A0A0A9ZHP5_LYGHE